MLQVWGQYCGSIMLEKPIMIWTKGAFTLKAKGCVVSHTCTTPAVTLVTNCHQRLLISRFREYACIIDRLMAPSHRNIPEASYVIYDTCFSCYPRPQLWIASLRFCTTMRLCGNCVGKTYGSRTYGSSSSLASLCSAVFMVKSLNTCHSEHCLSVSDVTPQQHLAEICQSSTSRTTRWRYDK